MTARRVLVVGHTGRDEAMRSVRAAVGPPRRGGDAGPRARGRGTGPRPGRCRRRPAERSGGRGLRGRRRVRRRRHAAARGRARPRYVDAVARGQPRARRVPRRGGARRPGRDRRQGGGPLLLRRGADDPRRDGEHRRDGRRAGVGAQRGVGREGEPRADARAGRRGRRPPAVALGLRRGRDGHADRLDRVRLLRRRPGRVARGRRRCSWSRSARTRCSRGRWSSRPTRSWPSRCSLPGGEPACCGATGGGPWTCRRAPGSRRDAASRRCASPGCTRRRSPTGWSPSSTCRSGAGADAARTVVDVPGGDPRPA